MKPRCLFLTGMDYIQKEKPGFRPEIRFWFAWIRTEWVAAKLTPEMNTSFRRPNRRYQKKLQSVKIEWICKQVHGSQPTDRQAGCLKMLNMNMCLFDSACHVVSRQPSIPAVVIEWMRKGYKYSINMSYCFSRITDPRIKLKDNGAHVQDANLPVYWKPAIKVQVCPTI